MLIDKYGGLVERPIFSFANEAWEKGPDTLARGKDVPARTKKLRSTPRGRRRAIILRSP